MIKKSIFIILLLFSFLTSCGEILTEDEASDSTDNSQIYIVGGLSGPSIASTVAKIDAYNPETNTWVEKVATLPTPVSFAGATSYTRPSDGHTLLIVIGGFDSLGIAQGLVQIYDINTGTWSNGNPITAAVRANIYATRVYDKIFILGGTSGNSNSAWSGVNTNYEYTIDSTWNTRTALAANVSERFSYAFNDVVYHIGGRSSAAAVAATEHNGWSVSRLAVTSSTETVISTPRTGMAGAIWVPDNKAAKIFLIGGFSSFTGTPTSCVIDNSSITASSASTLFQYLDYPFITTTTAWVGSGTITQYPAAIGFGSSVIYENTLYHFGGTGSVVTSPSKLASGSSSAYSTDLTALPGNTWSAIENMPTGRYGHVAVLIQK